MTKTIDKQIEMLFNHRCGACEFYTGDDHSGRGCSEYDYPYRWDGEHYSCELLLRGYGKNKQLAGCNKYDLCKVKKADAAKYIEEYKRDMEFDLQRAKLAYEKVANKIIKKTNVCDELLKDL